MKQEKKPDYFQERKNFEEHQARQKREPWCFPFRDAFARMKQLYESKNKEV